MPLPRLQFRLSTLLWLTLAVACFLGGMRAERWLVEYEARNEVLIGVDPRPSRGNKLMRSIAASIVVLSGAAIIASSIIAAALRHSTLNELDIGLNAGIVIALYGCWLIYAERRDRPPPSQN
jgi:hypothetical protein